MSDTANDLPIPGSIVILDVQQSTEHNKIVLSPAPSNDANDPLQWSRKRKQMHNALLVLCG